MPGIRGDDHAGLLRTGGISGLALGVGYFAIIAIYARIGAPPDDVEKRLAHMAAHTSAWWAIVGLSVLTDFLFVPLAASLHFVLRKIKPYAMLLATAGIALFVVLDLAITWTNYAVLLTLSGKYAAASTAAARTSAITIAEYPSTVVGSNLLFVYNTLVLSVAIFVIGFVMRKGDFGPTISVLGVITGLFGMVSVVGAFAGGAFSQAIILASLLTTIWVISVGSKLCLLARA